MFGPSMIFNVITDFYEIWTWNWLEPNSRMIFYFNGIVYVVKFLLLCDTDEGATITTIISNIVLAILEYDFGV